MAKPNYIAQLVSNLLGLQYSAEEQVEPAAGTPTNQEIEYTFYYKLTDPTQLFKADSVFEQEQWELSLPKDEIHSYDGKMRVRAERPKLSDAEPAYTLTFKVGVPGVFGRKELELRVEEEFFDLFKVFCERGMRKTRFISKIPGTEGTWGDGRAEDWLRWEVDVFDDPTSLGAEVWVKVDLEVPRALETLPEFPYAFDKCILNQWDKRTPEEQAFVKELMEKVFLAKK